VIPLDEKARRFVSGCVQDALRDALHDISMAIVMVVDSRAPVPFCDLRALRGVHVAIDGIKTRLAARTEDPKASG